MFVRPKRTLHSCAGCRIPQHAQQEAGLLGSEVWHVASSKQTERRHRGHSSGELQGRNRLEFDFHLKKHTPLIIGAEFNGRMSHLCVKQRRVFNVVTINRMKSSAGFRINQPSADSDALIRSRIANWLLAPVWSRRTAAGQKEES